MGFLTTLMHCFFIPPYSTFASREVARGKMKPFVFLGTDYADYTDKL